MLPISLERLETYLYAETRHDRSQWVNYKSRFFRIESYFFTRNFTKENVGIYLMTLENLATSTRCAYFDMLEYICQILKVDFMDSYTRPKVVNRKKFVLYEDEMKRLLTVAYNKSYRLGLVIELTLRTGLRFNEVRSLKWADLVGNEITLRDTKSGHDQTVYITNDMSEKIKKLNRAGEYMFANQIGLLSNKRTNQFLKSVLKEAGIEKKLTFHDLRHSAATDLMNHDVNLYLIKEIMRHSDIKTTERYLHTNPTKLLDAVRKHSLAIKNWTKEELNKEAKKFMDTISETNFKSSIVYGDNGVEIKISY